MRKKIIILLALISLFSLTACSKNNDAISFKETYESLNGKEIYGKKTRSISVPKDNPIKISSLKEINEMVDKKKTFYVYFGFESCPWCRSVVEKMIEVASEKGIKTIYYVDVRPGEDSYDTDIRDEYAINEDGKIYLDRKGSKEYQEFQKKFKNILKDYKHGDIESLDDTEFSGAKRLGAPNFIYVKNGKPKKLITGISEKQTDGYQKLTKDILKDEEETFKDFFE